MAFRVLLADDEPWALQDMKMTFPWEKYGFRVAGSFTKAADAWGALCSMRPELVVTDLRMPGISGVELMRRAREQQLSCAFILVSGVSDFEAARQAIRYGAAEYCLKPLDPESCEATLRRVAGILAPSVSSSVASPAMQAVLDHIDARLHLKLTLSDVAGALHISVHTLTRMFRQELDVTFCQYLETRRLACAQLLLQDRRFSVSEIAEKCGYADQNYFTVCFKRRFSMTPLQYRALGGQCD